MVFSANLSYRSLWTPEHISTSLWLDAADSSTITTVSGAVSQWDDKSGNGRNATQGTASERPAYSTNKLVFDGTSDWMSTAANFNATSMSIFIVANANVSSLNTQGRIWLSCVPGNSTNGWFHLVYRSNITNYVRSLQSSNGDIDNLNIQYLLSQYSFPSKSLFCSELGTTQRFYHYGELQAESTGLVAPNIVNGMWYLGNYYNQTGYFLNGEIYEIVVSDILDTSTRQRLEGYLAHKWGLTANLPSDHPYKNNPPRGL